MPLDGRFSNFRVIDYRLLSKKFLFQKCFITNINIKSDFKEGVFYDIFQSQAS